MLCRIGGIVRGTVLVPTGIMKCFVIDHVMSENFDYNVFSLVMLPVESRCDLEELLTVDSAIAINIVLVIGVGFVNSFFLTDPYC